MKIKELTLIKVIFVLKVLTNKTEKRERERKKENEREEKKKKKNEQETERQKIIRAKILVGGHLRYFVPFLLSFLRCALLLWCFIYLLIIKEMDIHTQTDKGTLFL